MIVSHKVETVSGSGVALCYPKPWISSFFAHAGGPITRNYSCLIKHNIRTAKELTLSDPYGPQANLQISTCGALNVSLIMDSLLLGAPICACQRHACPVWDGGRAEGRAMHSSHAGPVSGPAVQGAMTGSGPPS